MILLENTSREVSKMERMKILWISQKARED